MSCHCNVCNEEFSNEEWSRVEGVCKEYKMLDDTMSLQECIARDEKVIFDAGITFEQLDDLFESLQLVFHQSKAAKVPVTESKMDNRHFPHFADLPRDGWMPKGATLRKIMLFGHEYTVKIIVWGGAQTCPFQNFDLDKQYHGYDYGCSDYLLFREDLDMGLHMGSLLFHQIAKHHFFQGDVSPYRVDPTKLVDFFSLKPGVSYKVPVKHVPTRYWCGCSSGNPSTILEDTKRWELVTTTDDYYFFKRVQKEGEEPAYSKFCIAARHEGCPSTVMIDDIEHEIAWTIVNYTDRIIIKNVLVE